MNAQNADSVWEKWTSMGTDRPCFVVRNGAWTMDAYPHAFWPLLWVVFSSAGKGYWAVGRRHAIRKARKMAARRLFDGAHIDGSACDVGR